MKKLCLALSIVLALFLCGCSVGTSQPVQEEQEVYFHFSIPDWAEWGMKEGEVRQHLHSSEHKDDLDIREYGDLIYYTQDEYYKNHYRWMSYYGFSKENELEYISHSLNDNGFEFEENEYNQTFLELLELMKGEYGEPVSDDEKWHNERYKGDEYMLNKAIDDGDYTRKIKWKLDGHFCALKLDEGIHITYCIYEENI
jgi:hypothetical protein